MVPYSWFIYTQYYKREDRIVRLTDPIQPFGMERGLIYSSKIGYWENKSHILKERSNSIPGNKCYDRGIILNLYKVITYTVHKLIFDYKFTRKKEGRWGERDLIPRENVYKKV